MNQQQNDLRKEIRRQSFGYILAAFGFVAGLAWNDAIKALIDFVFPLGTQGLLAKFIYAVAVTILVIIATWIGSKLTREKDPS